MEEAFGTIGGLNLTSAPGVKVSNALQSYLSGYDNSAVTNGTFNALLSDVQTAFPNLTFSPPPNTSCGTACTTYSSLSQGKAFAFNVGTAVLYSIPMVPGPLPLLGVLSALHQARRVRRRIHGQAGRAPQREPV